MRRAVRTWRGCIVAQRETCSSSSRRLRLDCSNTAIGRRYGLRTFVTTASGSHDAGLARFPPGGEYRSTARGARAAQCGLGVVVLWANMRRAPQHAIGRGSTTPTPRQVGGTGFEWPYLPRSTSVARDPRDFVSRIFGRPPKKHAPRSARLAWLCCGPMWGTILPTPSIGDRPHQHRDKPVARA